MGKIRTRALGLDDVEQKQKKEQKRKADEKSQKKIRAQGLKGGERMSQINVSEEAIKKMEKAKEIINAKESTETKKEVSVKTKKQARTRGKKYQQVKKKIDVNKKYSLDEAIDFLKKNIYVKFDQSVELHFNVDKAGLKGEVNFPNSIGKTIRVKIVDDQLLADIERGNLDFDILVTHPSYMPKLAKFAKTLGPKGLMPNPKAGTISPKPEEVAKKFAAGNLRWKSEAKFPLIHQMIGKISLTDKALVENAKVFINAVGKAHIKNAYIKSTMSPSLKVDLDKV